MENNDGEKKHSKHDNFDYKGVEMSERRDKDESTEAEHRRSSVLASGINLDQQYENANPEIIADDDYDANVTCKTPFKYIKQKWCCRRERQVRYKVNN